MLETLTTIISSAGVVLSLLSIFWIYRDTGAINSAPCLFAIAIFSFTVCQWYHNSAMIQDWHLIDGLFVILAITMNIFYTRCLRLKVKINRRSKQSANYDSPVDRRGKK